MAKTKQHHKLEEDRISYSESVKVNIGDYESRDVHISYSTSVRAGEQIEDAFNRASKVVRKRLKVKEKRIRQASEEDVDFETMARLDYYNKG